MFIDNPLLTEKALSKFEFDSSDESSFQPLKVNRTASKALFCAVIVLISSIIASQVGISVQYYFFLPFIAIPFLILIGYQPTKAWLIAPIYSIIQGIILGVTAKFVIGWQCSILSFLLDWFFKSDNSFPGFQLCSNSEVFFCITCAGLVIFAACATGIISPKQSMSLMSFGAVVGPLLYYAAVFIINLLGFHFLYSHNEFIYIFFCCVFNWVICLPAASDLADDFEFIMQANESGYPELMEWYCAAALVFSIVWAYIQLPVILFIFCMQDNRRRRRSGY